MRVPKQSQPKALPWEELSAPLGKGTTRAAPEHGSCPSAPVGPALFPGLRGRSPRRAAAAGPALPARNYPVIDVGTAAKGICAQALWSFSNSPDLLNSLVGAG